ncbi:hypothetical protein VTN77DRAFT_3596 [Rasamsonia byssochlamydoides]|uniref:uncharacterized protein n=1 Tax=Rasamsonia byssochlamydoides TaxID=89139 RepID=UPI0037446127
MSTQLPAGALSGQGATGPVTTDAQKPATAISENVKPDGAAIRKEWDSERQIVSSLWKLQELETKIHQLRSLLPDRLLAPITPIVNPRKAGSRKSIPKSPQQLYESLAQCARDGVAEVEEFKAMWQSPELKAVWGWVDEKLKESNGQYPQPTGMWERDYDVILRNLENEERQKEEQRQKDIEEQERLQALSAEGSWRGVVESFEKRQLPGLRLLMSKNEAMITVYLGRAGMAFDVQEVASPEDSGTFEWHVDAQPQLWKAPSRLETAICANLNRRPRKWDLAYLLDMIYSYSDVRRTPCKKCNRMTDNSAQLPVVRRPITVESDGKKSISWEAYHSGCA